MEARARSERLRQMRTARYLRGRTAARRGTGHLGGVLPSRHLHDARQGHRTANTHDVRARIYREGREHLFGCGLHIPGLCPTIPRLDGNKWSRHRRPAPDIDFEQGGTLFDRLRHAYFTLLAMPDDANRSPVIERLQRRFSPVLAGETLPPSKTPSKRYGPNDGRLILLRPDGYIAFKCSADDVPLLEATLEGVVC